MIYVDFAPALLLHLAKARQELFSSLTVTIYLKELIQEAIFIASASGTCGIGGIGVA